MRIRPLVPSPFIALSVLPLSAAATTYTNPATVPVMLASSTVYASSVPGFYVLPSSVDFSPYYKEYTTPGPVLTFTLNKPSDSEYSSAPDKFRMQLWWVDPTPTDPVDDDANHTSDDDDTRIVGQNLDLTEPNDIAVFIANSVGLKDKYDATFPGTIFWRESSSTTTDLPATIESGVFNVATDGTSHLTANTATWATPSVMNTDYTVGTVGLYSYSSGSISTYTVVYNLVDNTETFDGVSVATFGKVFDDDMETIKMIAGTSTSFGSLTSIRWVNSNLEAVPMWNTYTDAEFDAGGQASVSDFVTIKSITISDPTGTDPTHGLKFIEAQPYVGDSDSDSDGTNETVYPNASFGKVFDYSLSPEGMFNFKLKDNLSVSDSLIGTYYFSYRVYVDDGVNTGLAAPYFSHSFTISILHPLRLYLSDATLSSSISYTINGTAQTWNWYSSDLYGWYLEHDFPNNRWVYSYEHGWLYLYGNGIATSDGAYMYDAPSSYEGGVSTDEIGWIWTRSDYYPYFYSYKDNGWVWYWRDLDSTSSDNSEDTDYVERILDKRKFWSFRQQTYITPSQFGNGL
jgi:hypothetical protein